MKVSVELDEQALMRWPLASLRAHTALCAQVLARREASAALAREKAEARKKKGFWHKVKKREYFLRSALGTAADYTQRELKRLPLGQRDPVTERFLDLPVRYTRGENSFCKADEILALRTYDKMISDFAAKHAVMAQVYSVKGNATGIYHEDRAALRIDLMPDMAPDIETVLKTTELPTYADLMKVSDKLVQDWIEESRLQLEQREASAARR